MIPHGAWIALGWGEANTRAHELGLRSPLESVGVMKCLQLLEIRVVDDIAVCESERVKENVPVRGVDLLVDALLPREMV